MQFFPPNNPLPQLKRDKCNTQSLVEWESVNAATGSSIPCQRSLHAGAVWKDSFVVFGGYDGRHRVNDLYSYNFKTNLWQALSTNNAPSPRDRHVATVHDNSLYIFGGFDGVARINDLHEFNLETNEWRRVAVTVGTAPTPRHSHAAVVYHTSMFIFGGYDGSYRSDFHEFNFVTRSWSQVHSGGEVPRARYRGTCVVSGDNMILHGGHDGNRHLQDTHVFDFNSSSWSALLVDGPAPSPRDSHVAVLFGRSMYLYGGSTGSAMGDFHELKLEFKSVWSPVGSNSNNNNINNNTIMGGGGSVECSSSSRGSALSRSLSQSQQSLSASSSPQRGGGGGGMQSGASTGRLGQGGLGVESSSEMADDCEGDSPLTPGPRFCHVGVVYDSAFYIFGGYDGMHRLNDFMRFQFIESSPETYAPPSTLISELKTFVDNDLLSDVTFIVEDRRVHAHKILCLRCPYFQNLLTGEYMESRASEITILDVKHSTFLLLMEYLYSDEVPINLDTAMDLFQVADRFGIERLKQLCEFEMLRAINTETAAHILYTADERNAENLRERCMQYILLHFDEVSKTHGFERMGHTNVALVFEILKRR